MARGILLRKCPSCLSQVLPGTWLGVHGEECKCYSFHNAEEQACLHLFNLLWKISGKQNFCKGNLISAHTQRCLLEEPKRNLSMRQRRLWKERGPPLLTPASGVPTGVVLCALRSQEQRPLTALPGPRLSGALQKIPGPSVFFRPLSQSWGKGPWPWLFA